ncbi:tryptophan synthase subunit beta [Candidatus Roizmanbacteria bacterium RIFOXYB2_FULL_38_10]|uniref:Tryptophan synthase beta chain n=1 Tax=Candidatus Roizmanbacteria bacterium RIFOXYD1_FULL_38_12 TaxID=1802093 RepID=A0A1F7L038_9BACT|nr:MAG: tryptophan synthase subunit beta [Candidatus Roizmanbacteria bacterium RIFOXYA2_FULL_38_14]OGK63509.1 MAG: tryptophan synthase subunit beta [Candidatus Roizmanbacteria bacterium RIFOXYA1_FULL_37_12]OGK65355.1 MAG: tryptophan synthase subunit beta [Candidatus Roizmanbacteria bacterium RIFOXYB1_FULL_40_23]OGK67930.1 MAG: tryptophan synthase subunit beta [Candidatus Roizmanbacteria bacterium RIFOXYB2_FULL_38_10]OGK69760.1 MAG: tryptophan synthase subunit beta [Candidatus Roizmanbacteria ba
MQTHSLPDKNGYFGEFGGRFVPPELESALKILTQKYYQLRKNRSFQNELHAMYKEYAGRPSNLYFAQNLTNKIGGAKIYLKREDLNHTGAHKINNCIGQGLIAYHMGKKKLIAETGAGQHGVATATIAAYFGMRCDIYMGARDIDAQKPNVYRMKILGANVITVTQGQSTLKDAVDAALTAYVKEPDSYYLLGSAVGPHPYPVMVRDFQKIIGKEARIQILKKEGKLPKAVVACVGGGSNAMGAFFAFLPDKEVVLIAVEPAGKGEDSNRHGLSLGKGKVTLIHGFKTLTLQDKDGNIAESYSAASGLDYPGVGPELSFLKTTKRLTCVNATDKQAVNAFVELSKTEGIIPALESAHAVHYGVLLAKKMKKDDVIIINLSGRGDKDVEHVYETFLK